LSYRDLKKFFVKNIFWCIYIDIKSLKPLKKGREIPKVDSMYRLNRRQDLFVKDFVSNHGMITHR
jgi:hypothetical protein